MASLIEALAALLATRSYLDVSQRDVAAQAGVSHAMIRYYFLSKDGLLEALVQQLLDRLIEDLQRLRNALPGLTGSPTFHLMTCFAAHIAPQPEVARLAIGEVNRTGSAIGDRVRDRLVVRLLSQCNLIVGDLIAAGVYRADLDRRHAILALTGLISINIIRMPRVSSMAPGDAEPWAQDWIEFCIAMLDSQFLT